MLSAQLLLRPNIIATGFVKAFREHLQSHLILLILFSLFVECNCLIIVDVECYKLFDFDFHYLLSAVSLV